MSQYGFGAVSKRYQSEPNAAEWDARLLNEFGATVLDRIDYPWDAPIPARENWDREIEEFRKHLKTL